MREHVVFGGKVPEEGFIAKAMRDGTPDSPVDFEVTITPVDAAGELLHDQKIEGEGSGTIK